MARALKGIHKGLRRGSRIVNLTCPAVAAQRHRLNALEFMEYLQSVILCIEMSRIADPLERIPGPECGLH